MRMIFNGSAKKMFDYSAVDAIKPDSAYPVWRKTDPYGRDYYGVSNFWNLDVIIRENEDLSWLEWDGNEISIDNEISNDISFLFNKTIGIIKSWQLQLKELCPEGRFVIMSSYDDGSDLSEESDPYFGFTLRFWKIREGQGLDENTDYDEPIIKWISD